MGQKAKSFKISHDLAEASVLRAKYMGYPSWASYVKTLIRRDIGGVIREGSGWQSLTLGQQDALDHILHDMVKKAIARLPTE